MGAQDGQEMNVEARVIAIVADQAVMDPAEVTKDSTLEGLGLDSLGLVECIFAIEETFEVSVPFNANAPAASDFDITTIASIVAGIERLKAEQG